MEQLLERPTKTNKVQSNKVPSNDQQNTQNQSLSTEAPQDGFLPTYRNIDHIALAVTDLEQAIELFGGVLGFELKCRRHINGEKSGMLAADFELNGVRFVLCQGTEPQSQVSKLIKNFGVGLAHVALEVDDVDETVADLKKRGLGFDTNVIKGPGLTQAFSSRDKNTGISFEFIKRHGEENFLTDNVQELFDQLEAADKY